MRQLHKNLESYLDFNDRTKNFEELADTFSRLKLDSLVLFGKARLDVLHKGFGGALVNRRVVQQGLFNEPDQLALGDGGVNLGLSKLEEKLQARHLVILFQLEKD